MMGLADALGRRCAAHMGAYVEYETMDVEASGRGVHPHLSRPSRGNVEG
jgi:hypothetical protein